MNKFFVGQRVRKARRIGIAARIGETGVPIGAEGTIVALGSWRRSKFVADAEVAYDHYGSRHTKTDVLEPVLYGKDDASTWDACLWRPNGSHKTEKVAEEGRAIALRCLL